MLRRCNLFSSHFVHQVQYFFSITSHSATPCLHAKILASGRIDKATVKLYFDKQRKMASDLSPFDLNILQSLDLIGWKTTAPQTAPDAARAPRGPVVLLVRCIHCARNKNCSSTTSIQLRSCEHFAEALV